MIQDKPNSDVLIGKEGFLFLVGGKHRPLDYAQKRLAPTHSSIQTFWRNIQWRRAVLSRRGIGYQHVIAPDKHIVCREVFPYEVLTLLGLEYLKRAPNSDLASCVHYPLTELSKDFRNYCYRVDTHFRPHGTAVLARIVLSHFGKRDSVLLLEKDLDSNIGVKPDWSGDLGSKLNPLQTESKDILNLSSTLSRYSNTLDGGNNGIFDLYLNKLDAPPLRRVMLFGDSYGREMAAILAPLARDLIFLRTPFLHIDLVEMAKPDLVITENAERYMSSVMSDNVRPMFFLYPFIGGKACHMSSESAQALSAFFAAGRPEASTYLDSIRKR